MVITTIIKKIDTVDIVKSFYFYIILAFKSLLVHQSIVKPAKLKPSSPFLFPFHGHPTFYLPEARFWGATEGGPSGVT